MFFFFIFKVQQPDQQCDQPPEPETFPRILVPHLIPLSSPLSPPPSSPSAGPGGLDPVGIGSRHVRPSGASSGRRASTGAPVSVRDHPGRQAPPPRGPAGARRGRCYADAPPALRGSLTPAASARWDRVTRRFRSCVQTLASSSPPAHRPARDGQHRLLLRPRQPQAAQRRAQPPGAAAGVRPEPGGDGLQPAAHQRPGEHGR